MASQPVPRIASTNVNGEPLVLRRIRPDDADRLRAAYLRLSPDSQRLRFFSRMPELSLGMAERLCDVDFVGRAALVFASTDDTAIHAVGRYDADGTTSAEVAITVEDAYQGHALGSALMKAVARHARANGINRLTAQVLGDNTGMLRLLRRWGSQVRIAYSAGVANVSFELAA